jgi:hypothetical protein
MQYAKRLPREIVKRYLTGAIIFLSLFHSFVVLSVPKDLMDNCGFLLKTLALPASTG